MLPELVIIGAPKCGTSSVAGWLAAHPEVCASQDKETFYLVDQGHPLARGDTWTRSGIAGYDRLFAHCTGARVRFEATTHYLYQRTAREVLLGLAPRPHILVLLREPARRVYSSFRYTRDTLARLPRSATFPEYLARMRAGDTGWLAAHCTSPASRYVLERDLSYSRYADWLAPWLAEGGGGVEVALLEDVVADPRGFMRGLAGRLGVAPQTYDEFVFDTRNPTTRATAPWLHRQLRRVAALVPRALRPRVLVRGYRAAMTAAADSASDEDRTALRDLAAEYEEPNRRLAGLLGRSLAPWHEAARAGAASGTGS